MVGINGFFVSRAMSIHPFRPEELVPGAPLTWEHRLDLAESEAEVIELAREYVAQLEHWEIVLLPEELRPRKMVDALDISNYAFELVRYDCEDDICARLIHKLAAFFSRCSIHLSQLLTRTNDPDGSYVESA
jgi:hypothetical protein